MDKLVRRLACICVAMAISCHVASAQEGGFLPMLASVCKAQCPTVCGTLNTFCQFIPNSADTCKGLKDTCDTACNEACSCVAKCGPDCDAVELNCNLAQLAAPVPMFCPIAGSACDVGCVVTCSKKNLFEVVFDILPKVPATMQQFIETVLGRPAMPPVEPAFLNFQ